MERAQQKRLRSGCREGKGKFKASKRVRPGAACPVVYPTGVKASVAADQIQDRALLIACNRDRIDTDLLPGLRRNADRRFFIQIGKG